MGSFQWRETVLTVINTHFDFDAEVQRRSAALIVERLEKQPHPSPALLAGDFNADPQSDAYGVFTSKASDFRNVFEGAAGPGTYHGFGGTAEKEPIDWILYRGPLILERADVIADRYEGIYPSDHFPLIAVFRGAS
jgi:endonuclease/exonuclease/phosphatase family metal-dependent hydrolase